VKRLQAFKFELMPDGEQERDMRRFAGARRFVYNKALAIQKTNFEAGGKFIGYFAMTKFLTEWKEEFPWLRESPSQALQQSLKDAERAFKNFFEKRTGYPRFKKRGTGDSFRFPQGFEIDQGNSRIKLPKLGWMRYRNSRDILGAAKNITISQSGGKWFASIQTEEISKNHAMVAVEDLQVGNMSRSAQGTVEAPGKNVAAKSGLNKAILDQGWFEFRRQLEYKLHWNGGILIAVPAHYTSQTCPACGHVAKENRQTQAKFECVDCGHEENADVVGAMNVLARGHSNAACGEDGSGLACKRKTKPASVKQEPTEATIREVTYA